MLVRWLVALLAVPVLLIAGCGGSSDDDSTTSTTAIKRAATKGISGPWTGELHQAGLAPFRIAVVINSNGGGGVAYTGIECGGTWMLKGGGDPTRTYTFTEEIKFGAGGNCKGTGTVHLTQTSRGTLAYRFEGGGVTSTGSLVPVSLHAISRIFRRAGAIPLLNGSEN